MLWVHLKTICSFRVYHTLTATTIKQRVGFIFYLWLLATLVFYFFTGAYIKKNLPIFLNNFPQVTFTNGVLTAPQKPVFAPIPNSPFRLAFDASRTQPPSVSEMVQTDTLVLVNGNTVYVPGASGMQTRQIPPSLNAVTSPDFLHQNQGLISAVLRMMGFITSLFIIPFILLFDFCLAGVVGLSFNLLRSRRVSRTKVFTWALFLLGPLSALWLMRLWVNIPLFSLAQVILCIIYMQQIFNTLPEEN